MKLFGVSQDYEFPALGDPTHFSVRIIADTGKYLDQFLNSKGTRMSGKRTHNPSFSLAKLLLDFLENRGTIGSVETLHFDKYSFYLPQDRP